MSSCIRAGPFDWRSTVFRWRVDKLLSSFLDTSDCALKDENITGNSWSSEVFQLDMNGERCFLTLQQLFDPTNGDCFGGVRVFLNLLNNEKQRKPIESFGFQFAAEKANYEDIYRSDFGSFPEVLWSDSKLKELQEMGMTFICCAIRPLRHSKINDWEPMPGLPRPTRLALELVDPNEQPIKVCLTAVGAAKEKLKMRLSKQLMIENHSFKVEIKSMKIKDAHGADYYEYIVILLNEGEKSTDAWSCTAWLEVQRKKWTVQSHKNERILCPFATNETIIWQSAGPANALREFVGNSDVHLCIVFRPLYADLPVVGPPCVFAKNENTLQDLKLTNDLQDAKDKQNDKGVEVLSNYSASDSELLEVVVKSKDKSLALHKHFQSNWNKRLMISGLTYKLKEAEEPPTDDFDAVTLKLEKQFEEMRVDLNNNEEKIENLMASKVKDEELNLVEVPLDDIVSLNADTSKKSPPKASAKFTALRNMFSRLGGKKPAGEETQPSPDHEDCEANAVVKQFGNDPDSPIELRQIPPPMPRTNPPSSSRQTPTTILNTTLYGSTAPLLPNSRMAVCFIATFVCAWALYGVAMNIWTAYEYDSDNETDGIQRGQAQSNVRSQIGLTVQHEACIAAVLHSLFVASTIVMIYGHYSNKTQLFWLIEMAFGLGIISFYAAILSIDTPQLERADRHEIESTIVNQMIYYSIGVLLIGLSGWIVRKIKRRL
ncbi:hypothetical protein M3Y96_00159700 [Aphelenchoides besseyi]|nr:hypothetical protein M3Y96_00159700 [Aphelenchoides besseyi]